MIEPEPEGTLIAIEGLDGSGKTTLAAQLEANLTTRGCDLLSVSLPWADGVAGGDINKVVRTQSRQCAASALALAFAANRVDQSETIIVPWLRRSVRSVVIADRHIGSGLAYQMIDGLEADWLLSINRDVRFPDVVLYVDTPVETCRSRMRDRGRRLELFEERLESASLTFSISLAILERMGVGVVRLDGTLQADALLVDAVTELDKRNFVRFEAVGTD